MILSGSFTQFWIRLPITSTIVFLWRLFEAFQDLIRVFEIEMNWNVLRLLGVVQNSPGWFNTLWNCHIFHVIFSHFQDSKLLSMMCKTIWDSQGFFWMSAEASSLGVFISGSSWHFFSLPFSHCPCFRPMRHCVPFCTPFARGGGWDDGGHWPPFHPPSPYSSPLWGCIEEPMATQRWCNLLPLPIGKNY